MAVADDLRARYAEALAAAISRASIVVLGDVAGLGHPPATTEMDLADAVLAVRDDEVERLRSLVAHYENTIAWHTTCHGCAATLDGSIRETERAEKAEAAIARVRELAARLGVTDPGLRDELLAVLDIEEAQRDE